MLDNIRLFVLTFLAAFGSIVGLFAAIFIGALPMTRAIWSAFVSYRSQLEECRCVFFKPEMWKEVGSIIMINKVLVAFSAILFMILMSGLMLGFIRIVLDIHEKGKSKVSRLFSCFHLLPKFLAAAFLVKLIIFAGFALFIIPGIYLMLRLAFFYYYIVDKNSGIIESIKKSWRATCGLTWEIFGLIVVMGIITKLSIFVGAPAAVLAMTAGYKSLPKRRK